MDSIGKQDIRRSRKGGRGSSIVTRRCDACKDILFRTSSLAKRILFGYFSVDFSQGKGMLFGNFGQRSVKLR